MVDERKLRDITIARPFTMLYRSGAIKRFDAGVHMNIDDEVAAYPHLHLHLLQDGQEMSARAVDVSDPAAASKRIVALEDEATRLRAEVEQHKAHAARAEGDLVEARAKADEFDAAVIERDALRAKNAALEADIERLTKPASKPVPAPPSVTKLAANPAK